MQDLMAPRNYCETVRPILSPTADAILMQDGAEQQARLAPTTVRQARRHLNECGATMLLFGDQM